MRKTIVAMQRLQSGHDHLYSAPFQCVPGQYRWSQIANQNGRRFLQSLTQAREVFVRGRSFVGGWADAIEHGSLQLFPMKAIIEGVIGKGSQRRLQSLLAALASQAPDIVPTLDGFQRGFVPTRATRLATCGTNAMAKALPIFALDGHHRYMMAKGR